MRNTLDDWEFDNDFLELANEFRIKKLIYKYLYSEDYYIYHYTNAMGLKGILENKTLRFTESEYLNDTTEGKYINDIITELLEKEEYSFIKNSIYERIINRVDPYKRFKRRLRTRDFELHARFFVCCFSTERDSLTMWQYYTKNNSLGGYAVKYDKDLLNNIVAVNQHLAIAKVYMSKVIYDETEQKAIVNAIIDKYMQNQTEEYLLKMAKLLQILGIFFKQPAFKDEREIRIVLEMHSTDFNAESFGDNSIVQFRENNGLFIPYIDYVFLEDNDKRDIKNKDSLKYDEVKYNDSPLKEILLSPTITQKYGDLYAESVRMLLYRYGFIDENYLISNSNIPFRPM